MNAEKLALPLACGIALLTSGCAMQPATKSRLQQKQADVAEILGIPLDPAEFGEARRCLFNADYRSFRAVDNRHIQVRGRNDKL